MSKLFSLLICVALLVVQYYVVTHRDKRLGFILPGICFVLSIVQTVQVLQITDKQLLITDNLGLTAFIVFVSTNIETVLLLLIYLRRDRSPGSVASSVLLAWLLLNFAVMTTGTFAFAEFIQNDETMNPSANIGEWHYEQKDYIPDDQLPIVLEDLGVETQPYRYNRIIINHNMRSTQGEYIDSLADSVENPQQINTLHYEVWQSDDAKELDKRVKQLQKRYSTDTDAAASYDYGAEATWLGDNLMLRYEDCVLLFHDDSTKELLDSAGSAEFFRETFELGNFFENSKK